jgi:4-amino-4-deoxy-L-arabinose transferase-like glycosyltransferase
MPFVSSVSAPPPTSNSSDNVGSQLLLALLCGFVFLTGLGATHLWDDDETYFAEVAREMHQTGDCIVPRFNRELFSHKPPMMFWLMAGGFRLFGISEFVARLPAALFGFASVLLVQQLGIRLHSRRAGFWSAVVLATSLNFVVIARAAACDAELVFFCTLAIFLYVRAVQKAAGSGTREWGEPAFRDWCAIYVAMGFAVLTKGPIGLLLPGCVLGLFRLLTPLSVQTPGSQPVATASPREGGWWGVIWRLACQLSPPRVAREVWRMSPGLALVCVVLVSGPWFAAVGWQTDGEFLRGFFGTHHLHRFTAGMDNHAGPAWFYLAAICVGFFPWILLARPVIVDLWRRTQSMGRLSPADRLLVCWVTVWVGFFSLATTKFPHYVVPAYPALALLTGAFVARWEAEPALIGRGALALMWGTLLLIGGGLLVIPGMVARHLQLEIGWLWIPGVPVVIGGLVAFWYSQHRQVGRVLGVWTMSTALFLVSLFAWTAVEVDRGQSNVALAQAMRAADPRGECQVASWHFFRPGLIYYSGELAGAHRVERLETPEELLAWLQANPGPTFVVARSDELARERDRLPADLQEVTRVPWFMKQGHQLVLLRRPAAASVTPTPVVGGGDSGTASR